MLRGRQKYSNNNNNSDRLEIRPRLCRTVKKSAITGHEFYSLGEYANRLVIDNVGLHV